MKTASEIIALIREYQTGYAAQDNIEAARVAKVLARLLDEAEGRKPPMQPLPSDVVTGTPNIAELREKYFGSD
jgi:hypothetical protein